MKAPSDLPIKVIREPIDGAAFAAVAYCIVFRRGWIYGLSAFVIFTTADLSQWHRWQDVARDRLLETLKTAYHGQLPAICSVNDRAAILYA